MKSFYRGMLGSAHLSPAAALRRAQITMLTSGHFRHPYYWAAFIAQGEWH